MRNAESETQKRIAEYVASLEEVGHQVHWPIRDTKQNDPTGGYEICRTNFIGILESDEVHIWYDETSNGSKFDMGGVFMLVEMLGWKKKVVIVNDGEIVDDTKKSFYKVFMHLVENTKMKYHKLVRDKIPEIIRKHGDVPITHIADEAEYWQKLKEKLLEEVREFQEAENMDELADILEVLDAIIDLKKFNREEIQRIKVKKAEDRGAFKDRIILDEA